jgi:DNA-binding MarR family transcriptional regulator
MTFTNPSVGPSFLLSQAGAHAALRFSELLEGVGLKPHHAGILRMLGFNPGMTQQTLSQTLSVFPSQLVLLVDFLERRQLIERKDSPHDRRQYNLYLTRDGRRTLAEIGRLTGDLEEELFTALNKTEIETLRALLRRIIAHQQITPGVHPAFKQLRGDQNMSQTFKTKIEKGRDKDVAGIVVPPEVVEALGNGKKPSVKITMNGYTYRSTVATMAGRFMIGLSKQHREASGLKAGELVDVRLELDVEPRITPAPDDLKEALKKANLLDAFDALAPSRRTEFVRQVEEAKAPQSRQRRIQKIVALIG